MPRFLPLLPFVSLAAAALGLPACQRGGAELAESGETADADSGEGPLIETLFINELLASNDQGLLDEDGDSSDWIELVNAGDSALSLAGWALSDDVDDAEPWLFPDVVLEAGSYLVVFASGKDRRPADGAELHTDFKLDMDGEALSLWDAAGRSQPSSVFEPAYPEMVTDLSYGRDASGDFVFWLEPTPGEPNGGESLSGWAAELSFSHAGGTFTQAFSLVLQADSADATIHYTLDDSEPTESHGEIYTSPLEIHETTRVRVKLFEPDKLLRPVQSLVYIALDEELAEFDSDLPIAVVDSRGYDFSQDDDASGEYPYVRCYAAFMDSAEDGRAIITGQADFAGQAGVHVRGASSAGFPKKSLKFEAWDEDDEDLSVSLLGLPSEADWVLHAPYFDKTLMRNHLVYGWWADLGYASPRSHYLELFVHSGPGPVGADDYEGVYLLLETIERGEQRVDITALEPEDDTEPAITGGYIVQSTNINPHFVLDTGIYLKHVYPDVDDITAPQAVWIEDYLNAFESTLFGPGFDDPESGYASYIDLDSHLDYDIFRELARNIDGASSFMSLDRGGLLTMGPLWDYNQSLGMTSLFPASGSYAGEEGWSSEGWNQAYMDANDNSIWLKWWGRLDDDPEYQERWAERWAELRAGPLELQDLLDDVDETAAVLEEAQARNYERWPVLGTSVWMTGDPPSPREAPGWEVRDTYEKEVQWMRAWLEARVQWIDEQQ